MRHERSGHLSLLALPFPFISSEKYWLRHVAHVGGWTQPRIGWKPREGAASSHMEHGTQGPEYNALPPPSISIGVDVVVVAVVVVVVVVVVVRLGTAPEARVTGMGRPAESPRRMTAGLLWQLERQSAPRKWIFAHPQILFARRASRPSNPFNVYGSVSGDGACHAIRQPNELGGGGLSPCPVAFFQGRPFGLGEGCQ